MISRLSKPSTVIAMFLNMVRILLLDHGVMEWLRSSYKRIQNNQKPNMILSDEHIQRLDDAGLKWSFKDKFEERFNDLMSF
jgi:hypothetical protein